MALILQTPRLLVREFSLADAPALQLICGNRRTMRHVGDGTTLAEQSAHLAQLIAAADRLGFGIRPARAQELLLDYLRARAAHTPRGKLQPALTLAERLGISNQAVKVQA